MDFVSGKGVSEEDEGGREGERNKLNAKTQKQISPPKPFCFMQNELDNNTEGLMR